MSRHTDRRIHIRASVTAMVFSFILIFLCVSPAFVGAAELLTRSVSVGSSVANEVTTHTFGFAVMGTSTVQSIRFQYCSNSPLETQPCTAPTGLNVSSFVLSSQTGITGFSTSPATTANMIALNRASSSVGPVSASYVFDSIQNPSAPNMTIYVRIGLYDGPNATGTRVDQGSVAFSTEEGFNLEAYVPPYLTFCVGITVALDCSSTDGALANFGELLSSTASFTTSQFAVSTNDIQGYNTFVTGQAMTSGNNIIPALTTQTASTPGTSQFGINLRANSSPSVGANIESGAVASGFVDSNYNTANQYRFNDGERVAASSISTGFNRYTVSYIVNRSEDQAPGVYATTLTYTSVASF